MKKLTFISSILSIFLSADITPSKTPSQKALRLNMSQEFHQKDPRKTGDLSSSGLHFFLHSGLTKMTPDSPFAELSLAKTVAIDSKGLIYTFKLRDCYYSNGDKITAQDFEKSWKEALDPQFFCPNSHLFFAIKNAKKAKMGLESIDQVGIKAIDDQTLIVTLEHPFKPFLEVIAFSTFAPFKNENLYSGPYVIDNFLLHSHLTLKPNKFYQHQNGIQPVDLEISFLKDEMTVFHLFEKNQLHMIGTPFTHIPKDAVEDLKKNQPILSQPNLGVCYLILNKKNPIFSDDVCLAIQNLIDRKTISRLIVNLDGKETHHIIPNAIMSSHLPIEEKKTFPISKGIRPLKLIYSTNGNYSKIAQFIEQEFLNKWNIPVVLQGLEPKLYLSKLKTKDYDLALNTLFAQYKDPMSILERFYEPKDPKNYPLFDSQLYRDKIDASNMEYEETKRLKILQEAEKILLENGGIIPLFETKTSYCVLPNVVGIQVNASGGFNFEKVEFKEVSP